MNAYRLLAHYERIADAPEAVARLRRFILDLAVRGKLVEQDPNDEPASELLKQVAAEKARLVKAGKFKTLDSDLPRDEASFPFSLLFNWAWCHLDDIAAIARGGSPRPIKSYLTDDPNGIPWIKIGDSVRGNIYIDGTKEKIKPEGLAKSRLVFPGDLLLSNSMSFGFPYITNLEGCIHDGWLVIRTPDALIDKLYLRILFLSDHAKAAFSEAASGAVVQNLNADKARRLSVPLPPLAEQHRIVAKVDELMALCDRLKAARTEREATRDRTAAASLIHLNAPDPDPAIFRDHAAFALKNLAPLTTRTDQIKDLRQTILNLAVRGKLVEQDPNDEPAAELLKRAKMTKAQATIERKIRKNSKPELSESAGENGSPIHWVWAYLHDLALVLGGKRLPPDASFSPEQTGNIYIRVADMKDGSISAEDLQYISDDVRARIAKYTIDREDLYITIAGTIGEVGEVPERFHGQNLTENAAKIVFREVDRKFLLLVLRSEDVQGQFKEKTRQMAQPKLALKRISGARIPLPPLAEQHRIVAKVDELMVLCDRIEKILTTGDDTRRRLLDTLLHEVLPTGRSALHKGIAN